MLRAGGIAAVAAGGGYWLSTRIARQAGGERGGGAGAIIA